VKELKFEEIKIIYSIKLYMLIQKWLYPANENGLKSIHNFNSF